MHHPILFYLFRWLMYLAGFAINVYMQAQVSVSSKSNGLTSTREWLALHQASVLWQGFAGMLLIPVLFHYLPESYSWVPSWVVYGACGLLASTILDKAFFLFGQRIGTKIDVPQLSPPPKDDPPSQP